MCERIFPKYFRILRIDTFVRESYADKKHNIFEVKIFSQAMWKW